MWRVNERLVASLSLSLSMVQEIDTLGWFASNRWTKVEIYAPRSRVFLLIGEERTILPLERAMALYRGEFPDFIREGWKASKITGRVSYAAARYPAVEVAGVITRVNPRLSRRHAAY